MPVTEKLNITLPPTEAGRLALLRDIGCPEAFINVAAAVGVETILQGFRLLDDQINAAAAGGPSATAPEPDPR